MQASTNLPTNLIRFTLMALFIGRGWQHLFFDAPYRAFLWDESWMQYPVNFLFGFSWETYTLHSDEWISLGIVIIGWIFIFAALVIFVFGSRKINVCKWVISIGTTLLILLALSYTKEKFYAAAQFFEYSLQVLTPVLFGWLVFQDGRLNKNQLLFVKVAIALTFVSHGLYAMNIYPRPALFTSMTINILSVTEQQAIFFLNVAGILDLVVSLLIFIHWKSLDRVGLIYCIIWGFLTAIARIVAHFYVDWWQESLWQWNHEVLIRFPHFMIPLTLLIIRERSE